MKKNKDGLAMIEMSYLAYEAEQARSERAVARMAKIVVLESVLLFICGLIHAKGFMKR